MSKKMKLPVGKLIMGALVLGGGYYAYNNRADLRMKVASLIGKKAIAAPSAAKALAAPATTKTVVAPAAKATAPALAKK